MRNAVLIPIVKDDKEFVIEWVDRVKCALPDVRVAVEMHKQQLIVNYGVLNHRQQLLLDIMLSEVKRV